MFGPPSASGERSVRGHEGRGKSSTPRRLHELDLGDVARIASIEAGQTAAKRLADMGFIRGAVLEMVRPGKPCLVRIGGTYVGLGFEHQRNVLIDRV